MTSDPDELSEHNFNTIFARARYKMPSLQCQKSKGQKLLYTQTEVDFRHFKTCKLRVLSTGYGTLLKYLRTSGVYREPRSGWR